MAETILFARVKQKKATEALWLLNPLILLDGEVAYVVDPVDPAVVVNYKIGVGDKTFAQLPYVIHYAVDATYQNVKKFIAVSTNQVITGTFKQGTTLDRIIFLNTSALPIILKVGYTDGGSEVGVFDFSEPDKVLDIGKLFTENKTLYISGISNLCSFFVQYTPFTDSPIIPPSGTPAVFKFPKGYFGYFYVLYPGHLEENFDTASGLGVVGKPFENCALTGTNDLIDYSTAYVTGIEAGAVAQAVTGNTANTVKLNESQLPPHKHTVPVGSVRLEWDDGGRYRNEVVVGGSTDTSSVGSAADINIRPRSIKMYSFVAITD